MELHGIQEIHSNLCSGTNSSLHFEYGFIFPGFCFFISKLGTIMLSLFIVLYDLHQFRMDNLGRMLEWANN